MSPIRTRAASEAIVGLPAVSTRSKTQKINNVTGDERNKDVTELIQGTKQSQRREKSLDIKNSLKTTVKQSSRKKSPDAIVKKSVKKKVSRRRNLAQETETEDKVTMLNLSMDTNESIKILKGKHKMSTTEHIKYDLSESNTSKDLDSNKKFNRKVQRKTVTHTNVKYSPIIVTPKSTPPKLSLTPHRSKKTPKKSPISLSSPKTHSKTVPRLFKSPRKLSLLTTSEDNLNESNNKSHNEKLKTPKKNRSNNYSMSHKSLLTSSVTKSNHKKSDNLKTIVHKFSKSPKIVLKSPKSKKSKLHKLKLLSPSPTPKVKKNSLKTSNITFNITPDLDNAKLKISTEGSSIPKEKNLSRIKRQLIKTLTASRGKDVLVEPIVLLERLSPERIQNMLTVANKIQSNTSITTRSSLQDIETNFKIFTTSVGSNMTVNRNSNTKLKNNKMKKLINRISPKIKYNTPKQGKDRPIPLMSSTPREENIPLIDMNLISNTSTIDISAGDTSINTRLKHKNQSNMFNVIHKSTVIENISKPSLFDNDINDVDQFQISNVMKRDTICDKDNLIMPKKEQGKKKRNTYELEQSQTLSLQQMIKKRSSTDANLSLRENFKKAKVHFTDRKFDTSNEHKSIKSIESQSNILHNVNTQRNNINSAHKSRKVETPKFNQNSLISPFKTRSSPRINLNRSKVQLNGIQITPKTFTLTGKKSEKTSSIKKVPNFGKLHEQMFAKSESLVDAKKRLEARHLAFTVKKVFPKIDAKKKEKRPLPMDTNNGIYNRFGFKLRKNEATHVILTKKTTFSREKQQQETRMMLKGVRMNRRFELQMKARNLNL